MQRFYADPHNTFTSPNGAVGYSPGGPGDCLGPYAKVKNCPVMVGEREVARLTCYAQDYADTWFSIPAATRYRGKRVKGYFTSDDSGTIFRVMDTCKHLFQGSQIAEDFDANEVLFTADGSVVRKRITTS